MEYYKYKVDQAKMEEIKDFYDAKLIEDKKRPYDVFEITTLDNVSIKCYRSKDLYTILFAGNLPEVELETKIFFPNANKITKHVYANNGEWEDSSNQIGSDEVGIGDFFLGFYVVATYLEHTDIEYISKLGVRDSKKLTDSKIEEIAPKLIEKIKKYTIRISPSKLDYYKNLGFSTHVILAKAHNLAHEEIIKKYHINNNVPIYVDQFEKEPTYLKYCNYKLPNPIVFKTKGETYFPSVATASVIARYLFLEDWKKMEEKFKTIIPKGASIEVDKTYKLLQKKYSQEELDPFVKHFFRNYKES